MLAVVAQNFMAGGVLFAAVYLLNVTTLWAAGLAASSRSAPRHRGSLLHFFTSRASLAGIMW